MITKSADCTEQFSHRYLSPLCEIQAFYSAWFYNSTGI